MKLLPFLLLSCFLLAGCGGEDNDSQPLNAEGVGFFIDSPVQGLSYASTSYSGVTDASGRFDYEDGEAIVFSFGDILLPSISASKAIHVSDLFANGLADTQTINLARLLLTIDSDADADNGIQLSTDALDIDNTPDTLDFNSVTFDADVANYIAVVSASSTSLDTLISVQDATEHIAETKIEVTRLLQGCGNECVPRAAFNEYVVGVSPRHAQIIDAQSAILKIEFTGDIAFSLADIELELHELEAGIENCRIDWPGLRCGDLGIASYDIQTADTRFSAASIDGDVVTFTLSGDTLASNKQYIAHIFNDREENSDDDDYKTWWLFYTK